MKPTKEAIEAEAVREVKSILNTISPVTDNETIAQNIVGKIIAAYAAQFPQSKDYEGLVERLRKELFDASGDDIIAAADAIEAVLAERDELQLNNAHLTDELEALGACLRREAKYRSIAEGQAETAEAERDALAARLAPVDDYNLEILAAKEFIEATTDMPPRTTYTISRRSLSGARNAIAAIRPHIEAAERERCAKAGKAALLKSNYGELHADANYADELGEEIAAAIRRGE